MRFIARRIEVPRILRLQHTNAKEKMLESYFLALVSPLAARVAAQREARPSAWNAAVLSSIGLFWAQSTQVKCSQTEE